LFRAGARRRVYRLESVREILTPHKPRAFTLLVLVSVVVVRRCWRGRFLSRGEAQSDAVKNDAFHHRADAITSAAGVYRHRIALIGGRRYEAADDWAA
jgi:divalent metal cation (Fe/Co/Zn/Cd) transporter